MLKAQLDDSSDVEPELRLSLQVEYVLFVGSARGGVADDRPLPCA